MTTKPYNLGDASLEQSIALPASNATVTSAAIDLETTATGVMLADTVVEVDGPILTVGELSNAATMTYDVIDSDNSDLSSPRVIHDNLITQTGAGGVGAAATSKQARLPVDVKRYLGVRATADTALDASAKSTTIRLKF